MKRSGALRWIVLMAAGLGLASLYARALAAGFLNDDYLFLEDARRRSLLGALSSLGPLGNYYRPVSRQLYFALLGPLAGGPLLFHLVNFGLFLGALALLADLLAAFLPLPGVAAGLLYFATLPFQSVNLTWISCSQDLLALLFSLAALALWRRRRDRWAAAAYLLAVFSKESALPLPLVLAFWPEPEDGSRAEARAARRRRLLPFGLAALVWLATTLWMRGREAAALPALLHFTPDAFAAGWVHEIQSLLGLDDPPGLLSSFARHGPAPLALLLLAAVVFLLPAAAPRAGGPRPPLLEPGVARFAGLWLLAFGFVAGPVAATWSSYYYTLAAAGGALLLGGLLRRVGAAGWLLLAGGLLWWHAAGTGVRAFAVADRPWGWTTHLSSFYFERADSLTRRLGGDLRRLEPHPPRGTRFFFATLPSFAGFQMGNGAQVRALYGDPTIESHFYSQFSDTTAGDHPCRFYWIDGEHLAPLFPPGADTFFQVGSDLLLFGKLQGARYAFLRALASGEHPQDPWYWLGWTELWLGHRGGAEAAWSSFGAKDDSLRWWVRMRVARMMLLVHRDTVDAKRQLAAAIASGIGRPEAHAVLGDLLLQEHPKYGLLELKIAASLNPYDWVARRGMLQGFVAMRLDDLARAQLEELKRVEPHWERDSIVTAAAAVLERRSVAVQAVARF